MKIRKIKMNKKNLNTYNICKIKKFQNYSKFFISQKNSI